MTILDSSETDLTGRATDLVGVKFEGKKYGGKPYTFHLFQVLQLVKARTPLEDEEIRAAAILHDIIEDTDMTREDVERDFGPRVARIVWAVTDGEGKNRRERHKAMFQKVQGDDDALLVKLADRYANVEHSWETKSPLLFMYYREYKTFRKALRREDASDVIMALWNHMACGHLDWHSPTGHAEDCTACGGKYGFGHPYFMTGEYEGREVPEGLRRTQDKNDCGGWPGYCTDPETNKYIGGLGNDCRYLPGGKTRTKGLCSVHQRKNRYEKDE